MEQSKGREAVAVVTHSNAAGAGTFVFTFGNRAALTDQTVADFGPELRRWVFENCVRPDNANLDIWLLPETPNGDA